MGRNTALSNEIRRLWEQAATIDPTLEVPRHLPAVLSRKRVTPRQFSRARLFRNMLNAEPSLFWGVPIFLRHRRGPPDVSAIQAEIRSGLPRAKRARVRVAGTIQHLPIPQVLDRWSRARSVFGVTDLHYASTHFDSRLDTVALNDFNLLPRGTDGFQSQDSLVLSAAGALTDSHSDDHSGSNHCFAGAKLWLMWDTLEGLRRGLEDFERCDAYGQSAFDVPTFLSMQSSRWLLITARQTMFIPVHLTHKVITLERYLGLGSFHAALPGFLDTLVRWAQLPPLWAGLGGDLRCCVGYLVRRAIRRIDALRSAPRAEQNRWGVPFLRARIRQMQTAPDPILRALTFTEPNLIEFIRAAQRL